MALIQNHFFSEALTECNSLDVIIPVEKCEKDKYPVLWLLPPSGYDHTAWQRRTDIERIAEMTGIMVIMPDMKLSYGLDMTHGFAYDKMLMDELPEMMKDYFPADMEKQMIVGAEESAYTAIRSALRFPGRFQAVAAFSGGSLMDEDISRLEEREKKQIENAFGTSRLQTMAGGPYDLKYWMEHLTEENLKILVAYSKKDRYGLSAQIMEENLRRYMGEQVKTEIVNEPMSWKEWAESLERMLLEYVNM